MSRCSRTIPLDRQFRGELGEFLHQVCDSAGERRRLPGVAETFSISLEPDVNTDAEFFDQLPADRIADLVKELARFTTELAIQGDCP